MTTIQCVEGEYRILWTADDATYAQAINWIFQTFGYGWGHSHKIGGEKRNRYSIEFKRLYHAQWFLLKWGSID
jgi:hypothetical protein